MVTQSQAPHWTVYAGVHGGYRKISGYRECLHSLFRWHTETVNAWTMIVLCLASSAAVAFALATRVDHDNAVHVAAFVAFWLSNVTHAPFSVGYHTFMPVSQRAARTWRRLDTSFLFVASTFLTFAMCGLTWPLWLAGAWTTVAGCVTARALWKIWAVADFDTLPRQSQVREIGYVVCCYFAPIASRAVLDAASGAVTVAVKAAAGVAVSLGLGAWAFAAGFPQCVLPGRFDYVGHSHQLMHMGVIAAHVCELWFMVCHANYYPGRT